MTLTSQESIVTHEAKEAFAFQRRRPRLPGWVTGRGLPADKRGEGAVGGPREHCGAGEPPTRQALPAGPPGAR